MDYKYFAEKELKCSVSGECKMNEAFMQKLIALREKYGSPMFVTSGYRHPTRHPIERVKETPGYHAKGRAIDVHVSGHMAHKLVAIAMEMGLTCGIQQKGDYSKRFIHIDDREDPIIYSY